MKVLLNAENADSNSLHGLFFLLIVHDDNTIDTINHYQSNKYYYANNTNYTIKNTIADIAVNNSFCAP